MKAYKVFYDCGFKSTNMIILVDENQTLEEALSEKDKNFEIGYSRVKLKNEIPLSNVLVSDLSVTEFLKLMKKSIDNSFK